MGFFIGHHVALFAVAFFQIGDKNHAYLRQRLANGGRERGDRVAEILFQILFGHRHGGEVSELAPERDHLRAKAKGHLFNREFGMIGFRGGHS